MSKPETGNWKSPPVDTAKRWLNKSLELQILLACNWQCIACDQGSQFGSFDFVKKGTMSIEQVRHFIVEMKAANAFVGRIRVMGGEPTVHPRFREIIEMLHSDLVITGHVFCLEIVSNGSHKERIEPVKSMVKARISGNNVKQSTHVANLIHTPQSLGYEGRVCGSPWHCGFSLNAFGYFPCSSGAGIARFEDWMKWRRATLPSSAKPCNAVWETWPDLKELCGHCYHGLRESDKVRCGTSDPSRNKPGDHIKPKIDEWKAGKKAEWARYGEEVNA